MKRFALLSLAAILVLSLLSPVMAAQKEHQLTGNIQSIDTKSGKVEIKGARGELTCTVNSDTDIKIDGEKKDISALKVGDKVLCKYIESDQGAICKAMSPAVEKKKEEKK